MKIFRDVINITQITTDLYESANHHLRSQNYQLNKSETWHNTFISQHHTIMSDVFPNIEQLTALMKEDPKIMVFTAVAGLVLLFLMYATLSSVCGSSDTTPTKKNSSSNSNKSKSKKKKKKTQQPKAVAAPVRPSAAAPAAPGAPGAPAPTKKNKNKNKNKNKKDTKKKNKKKQTNATNDNEDEDIDLGGTKQAAKQEQQQRTKAAAQEKMYQKMQAAANAAAASNASTKNDNDGWETQTSKKSSRQSKQPKGQPQVNREGRAIPGSTVAVQQQRAQVVPQQQRQAPPPPTDEVELSVLVESRSLGRIIGEKGSMLNKIQELTGARIDIPRRTQGADGAPQSRGKARVPVSVKGTRDAAKEAKKIIQDLVKKGYSKALADGDDFVEHNGALPTDSIHEIVGSKGSIIMKIKDGCNVKINIADNKERSPTTRVTVAGTKEGVEKARSIIKSICEKHFHPFTHPGFNMVSVSLSNGSEMGLVIGAGGSNIKHIQSMSKCRVYTPERYSDDQLTIKIVGPEQGLKLANKMINGILTKAEEAQKEWEEKMEKKEEAEANGDDPDMMEVEPELQKYLRPTSQMTIDLGIN